MVGIICPSDLNRVNVSPKIYGAITNLTPRFRRHAGPKSTLIIHFSVHLLFSDMHWLNWANFYLNTNQGFELVCQKCLILESNLTNEDICLQGLSKKQMTIWLKIQIQM